MPSGRRDDDEEEGLLAGKGDASQLELRRFAADDDDRSRREELPPSFRALAGPGAEAARGPRLCKWALLVLALILAAAYYIDLESVFAKRVGEEGAEDVEAVQHLQGYENEEGGANVGAAVTVGAATQAAPNGGTSPARADKGGGLGESENQEEAEAGASAAVGAAAAKAAAPTADPGNCTFWLQVIDESGALGKRDCAGDPGGLLGKLEAKKDSAGFILGTDVTSAEGGLERSEALAGAVDAFLSPRLEWRIVAERFERFTGRNVKRGSELFYDPAVFAPTANGGNATRTFAAPAAGARSALLKELGQGGDAGERAAEESLLHDHGVDCLLVKVLDPKFAAFAEALRRYQFPDDCGRLDAQTAGRTFVTYASSRDFLGALTISSVGYFKRAIRAGAPYVEAGPAVWGRNYHFENCTEPNGIECGFLPIYGGRCLEKRVKPALECMGSFRLGFNQNIVLPRDGIPEKVCAEGHKQIPALPSTEMSASEQGPPQAWKEYCPSCDAFGPKAAKPTPEDIADRAKPIGIGVMEQIEMPIADYVNGTKQTACTMELAPARCEAGRDCCADGIGIPQNVLAEPGSDVPITQNVNLLDSALSSYLTRFNRMGRRRIARLHQPRAKAMDARDVGWEEALSVGNCATLHIRRGDNIDRCNNGVKSFCSMDLSLDDYMTKAVPMLKQLGNSRHVFVMTDDAEVVADDKLKPWQTKGYHLEVVSGYNQYSEQTYNDWDTFIESLHAAKYCRVVVGHHISTVSKLVFRSSCARFLECPIVDMMENPPSKDEG